MVVADLVRARGQGVVIGLGLAVLVAFGLIGIGVGALFAPRASSHQYGIAHDDPRALALIRAMGVRDVVLGAFVLLLAATGQRGLLALGIAISAAVALLDFAVVAAEPSARRSARVLHGGGALLVLAVALVIAAGF